MTKEYLRISELIARDKFGILTTEGKAELGEWLKTDELHRSIYSGIIVGEDLFLSDETEYLEAKQKAWARIEKIVNRRSIRLRYWWGVACMTLVMGVATILLVDRVSSHSKFPVAENLNEIMPGGQKAILELSDGRTIVLSDTSLVVPINGGSIRKTDDGLVYKADTVKTEERINVLTVPRGGEYKLLLTDGTEVWLNSDSRLVYPEAFVGNERRIELQGEAYFKVTKNAARPFIIKTRESDIQVLGTEFNVKAYDKEGQMTTTLTEGSVMLTTLGRSVILKPDQQAVVLMGGRIDVRDVDAADYSAWRNGKFVFRRERLDVIMEDVARWYNVEIFYQNPEVRGMIFSGKMDRYEQVKELLGMLEKTGKITFGLKGKAIIVNSK